MEDAPVTIRGLCGEGETESSVPGLEVVVRGESGRNELLRGPFALFGVRGSAKLVRNLAKHRRTPMSPPQLIPPTSPGQFFTGDGTLRRRGHGSPPVLSEVFSSLALRCALQRVQTVPAAIHSGRIPPPQPTSHGDGRLSHHPHHTGHGPFRTRPPGLS